MAVTSFTTEKRPPLGLAPEFEHEHQANLQRVRAIMEAIERYCAASTPVPTQWFEELQRRAPSQPEHHFGSYQP